MVQKTRKPTKTISEETTPKEVIHSTEEMATQSPAMPVAFLDDFVGKDVHINHRGLEWHGPLRKPPEGDNTYDYRVGDLVFFAKQVSSVSTSPVNGLTIYLNQLQ